VIDQVEKRKNKIRVLFDGLDDNEIEKLVNVVGVVNCRSCQSDFVSDNVKIIQICQVCKSRHSESWLESTGKVNQRHGHSGPFVPQATK